MELTVGSVFAGIGGLDLAAHWAGFRTKWFVEKEPFCQKVLAKHWPDTPVHSDVFECHNLEHVSVLCGGFPCQPFSVAGNRKGSNDERYLLPEMLRLVSEVKPYVVLFENVPGFPQLNDGAEFKYLLRTLAEMGFDAEWGHLRASDCGAPHQRERWFCVAYAEGARAGRYAGRLFEAGRGIGDASSGRARTGDSRETLADTASLRRKRHPAGQEQDRFQQGRTSELARGNQFELGNADGKRLEGQRASRKPIMGTRHRKAQLKSASHGTGQSWATEPRLCGTLDGLPGWMDFVGWPARPGEDQYAYEPSRVTSAKTPDRAARLKALGNAVVPQVAYPLFAAIHEWLTACDAESVA